MAATETSENLRQKLRRLSVEDARLAREFVNELLDNRHPALDGLLHLCSSPGEGRCRHVIAVVARIRPDKDRLIPTLLKWIDTEVDEFTREAIDAALEGIDSSAFRTDQPQKLPDLIDTYRYVAERLCHKLRNGMSAPSRLIRKLQAFARKIQDDALQVELSTTLTELQDAYVRLSRLAEFNISDEYFQYRPIALQDWLRNMNTRYVAAHEPVHLDVRVIGCTIEPFIRANDHLLEIIFWNLWNNTCQAVSAAYSDGTRCEITVDVSRGHGNRIEVMVRDNGPGIPSFIANEVFQLAVSTKGEGRGRGLLEVQDAVRRLFGNIRLLSMPTGDYRILMSFPEEMS